MLANEEVIDGKSERGGHPVQRIPLRQWMLRITAYADRLEKGLDQLDWPESIKLLQRNWIGRSTGAEVDFFIGPSDQFAAWQTARQQSGWPTRASDDVLRAEGLLPALDGDAEGEQPMNLRDEFWRRWESILPDKMKELEAMYEELYEPRTDSARDHDLEADLR